MPSSSQAICVKAEYFLFWWLSYLLHLHCSEISQQSASSIRCHSSETGIHRHIDIILIAFVVMVTLLPPPFPRAPVSYMAGLLDHFLNFQSLFSCLSFLFFLIYVLVISLVDSSSPLMESFIFCLIPRVKKKNSS